MDLKIGDAAPNFEIKDQDGQLVKMSDFKEQKVVLYFYPKDATPGCTAQACDLRDNHESLKAQGYVILGISTDSEKRHQSFIAKQNLPFTLLSDVDKKVHDLYGTWIEKQMYGRKYMGTQRVTFIIDEKGIISNIIDKVKTKAHAAQILN